ncbi:MAG: SDR family oxidoreductase [Actinomycetota bacterium]|nr:SDR family oxidoreductase [Actinomycetota bacterium]
METWLVTGSRGFLGTNAAVYLSGRARLVGQARTTEDSRLYERIIGLDLRDAEGVGALVREVNPDVVLHAAAISGHETSANDPEQAFAVNVVATKSIAEACADIGARMVHISTDAVFDGSTGGYSEVDEPQPFSYYGETKLGGEQAVRDTVEDHLIVRTNFFGWSETGRKSVLEFFVNSLREGRNVRGYPDFVVTSLYVPALLQAIWDLGEIGAVGTVHVASSDALSKYDFGMRIAEQFGLDPGLIARQGPDADAHTASRSRDLSLDTSRVAAILGAPMQTQGQGIAQAYHDEPRIAGTIRDR